LNAENFRSSIWKCDEYFDVLEDWRQDEIERAENLSQKFSVKDAREL
jgi:hypothetical protein